VSGVTGATRRQQYSASTKRALVDVAEELFTESGYANTSLDAIVAGARVTKGALYHHFSGKQALFEAVFENWESEFLQMGAYVLLTALLFSRGSAESKDPDGDDRTDDDLAKVDRRRRDVPWPVRHGGVTLLLYQHSLTIALLGIFVVSFALHAVTGAGEYSADQLAHGGAAVTPIEYLATSRFWFESFQNWQSEFLAVGALIVLSIFLRQRGSPESKPVGAAHDATGVSN
jgi:AcrR family transcriptional regulator